MQEYHDLFKVMDELHYLGVLSFLINFIVFNFILCFLEAILALEFLFSIFFVVIILLLWV